jgi:murein DD-endopeptidase MepM/ murein hydrolase activator NlpD
MDYQILLLPSEDYWSWVRASSEYVMRFGPNITSNPNSAAAYMAPKQVITFPRVPNAYGEYGDIEDWFRTAHSGIRLDVVDAQVPDHLQEKFNARVNKNDRYGQKQRPFYLLWPTDFPVITQEFRANPEVYGRFGFPGHEGVDFRARPNTNIYACADGVVYRVHKNPDNHPYGIHVRIQHDHGYKTVYSHFAKALVSNGQMIKAGDIIGKADSTGASVGSHLHLTLKRDGATERGETDYPKDVIDPTPFLVWPEPASSKGMGRYGWPDGKMLFGAHGRVDAQLEESDFEMASIAKLDCIKIECCESDETILRLREISPEIFIMVRLTADFSGAPVTADDFVRKVEPDVGRFFRQGVQYFELHANPNLQLAGWRRSWMNGSDFSGWFLRVKDQLKHSFPEIKIGFPGLSPGKEISGWREDADQFMHEAEDAMASADWIGVNCFWTNMSEMISKQGRGRVIAYRKAFPNKLLFVTEFNNPSAAVKPETKAQQYISFRRQVSTVPGVGAIFSYAMSSVEGNSSFDWTYGSGCIADVIGKRAA